MLIYKNYKEQLYESLDFIPKLSMDVLISLITDINLFNESPKDCLKHLNIVSEETYYNISMLGPNDSKVRCESRSLRFPDDEYYPYIMSYGDLSKEEISKFPHNTIVLSEYSYDKTSTGFILKYSDEVSISFDRVDDRFSLLF